MDFENDIFLFTDSSTLNNGQRGDDISKMCCSGLYVPPNKYKNIEVKKSIISGEVDINRAEMEAIRLGVRHILRDYKDIAGQVKFHLITDNGFSFESLTNWIHSWIKNARNGVYYNASGKPVANQDIIKKVYHVITKLNIQIYHIRSHIPASKFNEYKDKFNKVNNMNLSSEQFRWLSMNNDNVDKVAQEGLLDYLDYKARGILYVEF